MYFAEHQLNKSTEKINDTLELIQRALTLTQETKAVLKKCDEGITQSGELLRKKTTTMFSKFSQDDLDSLNEVLSNEKAYPELDSLKAELKSGAGARKRIDSLETAGSMDSDQN